MERIFSRLTVYFENPFWVGVYERECGDAYEVCKITFGTEPKDYEVYDFLLKSYPRLLFRPAPTAEAVFEKIRNPKRMQREISRQLRPAGVGTKAQQALQQAREEMKTERRAVSAEQREAEKNQRYEQRKKNRKEKHRGH